MNAQQQLLLSWQLNTPPRRCGLLAALPLRGTQISYKRVLYPLKSKSGLRAYFTVMVICFE
jgi:hypothetical protein